MLTNSNICSPEIWGDKLAVNLTDSEGVSIFEAISIPNPVRAQNLPPLITEDSNTSPARSSPL